MNRFLRIVCSLPTVVIFLLSVAVGRAQTDSGKEASFPVQDQTPNRGNPSYEATSEWIASKLPQLTSKFQLASMAGCKLRLTGFTGFGDVTIPLADVLSIKDMSEADLEDAMNMWEKSSHYRGRYIFFATKHKSINIHTSLSDNFQNFYYIMYPNNDDSRELVVRFITALQHTVALCPPPASKELF